MSDHSTMMFRGGGVGAADCHAAPWGINVLHVTPARAVPRCACFRIFTGSQAFHDYRQYFRTILESSSEWRRTRRSFFPICYLGKIRQIFRHR